MNHFKINFYNNDKNISIIILFLGDYLRFHDTNITLLYKYLKNDNYDGVKKIITKTEFNLFKKGNMDIIFIDDNIYHDDSIYDLKYKIIMYIKEKHSNILIEEMYLFGETLFYYNNEEIFESLSGDNYFISKNIFDEFVNKKNLKLKPVTNNEIGFDEFIKIGFNNSPIKQFIPIGVKFNDDLHTNIFNSQYFSDKR